MICLERRKHTPNWALGDDVEHSAEQNVRSLPTFWSLKDLISFVRWQPTRREMNIIPAIDRLLRGMELRLQTQAALIDEKVDNLRTALDNFMPSYRHPSGGLRVSLDETTQMSSDEITAKASDENTVNADLGCELLISKNQMSDSRNAKPAAGAGDKEDCKRLKEKLKGALELEQSRRSQLPGDQSRETWMEYIFGICKPDGRVGKQGSRCGALV